MIKNKLHFEYSGETSEDHGLYNGNIGRGMGNETFVAATELIEEVVRGREKPYFKRIKRDPLTIPVTFIFKEPWNKDKIREVARWLTNHKIYQPLRFYDDISTIGDNRIFFALIVENSEVIHNYLNQGYLNLTFRCDAPWAYLPIIEEDKGSQTSFTLNNPGDLILYPRVKIDKTVVDGSLVITNTTNNTSIEFYSEASGSGLLKFTGTVYDAETIEIGNEIYEFDTGDGEVKEDNILVDLYQGGTLETDFARGTLNFHSDKVVKDGDTITIGNDIYEFDADDYYRHANIPVDISSYMEYATGYLILETNPEPYEYIIIGNTRYIFDLGTNDTLIKTTNHGVDSRSGFFLIMNRSFGMAHIRFVVAKDRDFLQLVTYVDDNPFDNPTPDPEGEEVELEGQKPEDVIEIYSSKYEGEAEEGTTSSQIVVSNTQGLRSGDIVGIKKGDGSLEFIKIKAVSNNNSITLAEGASVTPTTFYAFNRVALRSAEGPKFEIPNIVVLGTNKNETAARLVDAINLTGIPSLDFGLNLAENLLVKAELDEYYGNRIKLTSKFIGSQGNAIVTTVSSGLDEPEAGAKFVDDDEERIDHLVGGEDCPTDDAKNALLTAINEKGEEKVVVESDSTYVINFRYEIGGTVGNGVICLANTEGASWEEEYFEGGKDPTKDEVINELIDAINANTYSLVSAEPHATIDDTISITHVEQGLHTNIPVKSNAYNGFWGSRRLVGGRNELIVGEEILIDCERQQIESDEDEYDRYDCFSDTYLELELGDNSIIVTGDCNITFWLLPRVIQG